MKDCGRRGRKGSCLHFGRATPPTAGAAAVAAAAAFVVVMGITKGVGASVGCAHRHINITYVYANGLSGARAVH